ncbi:MULTISPECIES: hypothetical protein [unclassified Nocardioides]|uniref:hypothetical protein n=1 Tax=unclassified Nocardioides TaxID=2615069 RepID=UPI0006FADA43|nr:MULTISPECIES: hypothetical protein [unclassified Nocardioides]
MDVDREVMRYDSTIRKLRQAIPARTEDGVSLALVYQARESALLAVHVAQRMIGALDRGDLVRARAHATMEGHLARLYEAKWNLGRVDGTYVDFAAPESSPDPIELLRRFEAVTSGALDVADACRGGIVLPAPAPLSLQRRGSEVLHTESGVPLVPTVCPVVVLTGSNEDMGRQYAQQVVDIYGTWIFDRLAARVISDDTRLVLAEWESQLARHAPEVLDFARGWADGAASRGIALDHGHALAVWTGYNEPAHNHVMFGEELSGDSSLGVHAYSGAHFSPSGEVTDMCSGFCAWSSATVDGGLVGASTTDHDCTYQATIVAFPDRGNSFVHTPFSANGSIPGLGRFFMAGHPGFNDKGVAYVHHGGQGIDGASGGGGPREQWGYGLRRGASTFHALQFADTAQEARDMMLSFPVGDPGPILGTAGGLFADAHYGVAIEERAGSPEEPRPILREHTEDANGELVPVLYANNNPLSEEPGSWAGPREGKYVYSSESGWYIRRPDDAGTSDPALLAARLSSKNSAARNRFFHRQMSQGFGSIDVDFVTSMYRTSGSMPDGDYPESVERWNAGEEWEASAAHRGNAFTAVIKPSSSDPGEYHACIGPADRHLQIREPSHGHYYFDETGEFWRLRLMESSELLLKDAEDEARRRVDAASARLAALPDDHPERGLAAGWLTEAIECLASLADPTEGGLPPDERAAVIAKQVRAACRAQVRAAQVIRLPTGLTT